MFHTARLKLTAWYLLIIMSISGLFSLAIYRSWTHEIERFSKRQRYLIEQRPDTFPSIRIREFSNPELMEEARGRLRNALLIINGVILGISGAAGYFLAGRTLRPIAEMVDEQKRFISDASHELRTPLTSIKSEIEVSLREKRLTVKEAKKVLESNLEEANNLQTLSDRLIELTKFEYNSNSSRLTFKKTNTGQILKTAIKRVSPIAKKKGIKITAEIGDAFILGDEDQLVELLVILLDNAIKYSAEKSEISVTSGVSGKDAFITVADKGIGISKEDLPHVFDRFYRADKSRCKLDAKGYGLGLSIAKKIADNHKGTFNITSESDKGTKITIKIPLAK